MDIDGQLWTGSMIVNKKFGIERQITFIGAVHGCPLMSIDVHECPKT